MVFYRGIYIVWNDFISNVIIIYCTTLVLQKKMQTCFPKLPTTIYYIIPLTFPRFSMMSLFASSLKYHQVLQKNANVFSHLAVYRFCKQVYYLEFNRSHVSTRVRGIHLSLFSEYILPLISNIFKTTICFKYGTWCWLMVLQKNANVFSQANYELLHHIFNISTSRSVSFL